MLVGSADTGTPEKVVAQLLQEEPPLHTVAGYEAARQKLEQVCTCCMAVSSLTLV